MAGKATPPFLKKWLKLSNELLSHSSIKSEVKSDKLEEFRGHTMSLLDVLDNNLPAQQMDEVCQQLVALFRSKTKDLCRLVMELIPSLIWSYLSAVQSSRSKTLSGLEACLLTIYNLAVAYDSPSGKGTPYIAIPSLGRSSVYHEVGNLAGLALTESTLSKYEPGEKRLQIGPFPIVEKFNAKNRLSVLSHLIRCYSKEIGLLSSRSHQSLCALSIKVCCTGFKTYLSHRLLPHSSSNAETNLISRPRIIVSPEFLCEILHATYFTMFNGQPELGLEVLECVHQRANYELYASVILLTNAIKNSLEHNPSGQPYDGPMGVSIAITPAHILNSLNKKAITNASFRTQKLPDDITPEADEESPSDTEGESKNVSTAGKLLGGIKISTNPLKSALKRVERSITLKKNVEVKDTNPSPARTDRADGHFKLTRQTSSGKEKMGHAHNYEVPLIAPGNEYDDAANGNVVRLETYHSVVDPDTIEIVIEPPPEDGEHTKL